MKIAFVYSKSKLSGKLTKFFTGSYCYHVAWVDEKLGMMWDMNLIRRTRVWPHYPENQVILVDSPVDVKPEYLYQMLRTDENKYGVLDYLLFALRPLYHLVGKSTPNAGGTICSEMVYQDLVTNGFPDTFKEVPSPADLEELLLGKRNAIDNR